MTRCDDDDERRAHEPGPRTPPRSRRRQVTIGDGVIASAAADERQMGPMRSYVIEYVLIGLVTTGFGTCGLAQLFGAH